MSSSETLPADAPPAAPKGRVAAIVGSPWAWLAFFAVAFGFHVGRAILAEPPRPPPPILYEVPAFSLTDQFETPFGSDQLRGRIWVGNFIFTHCPTLCEGLTKSMRAVQKRLRYVRDEVYLVSFSVDPENDTPERLAAYAKEHEAKQATWRFLTGELGVVKKAVVDGFKQPMEPLEPGETPDEMPVAEQLMNITHGTRFVLVDRRLRIRGYYETDDASIDRLLGDITLVGAE